MDNKLRLHFIKQFHLEYINNWDKEFPPNQYANWKEYDVNDVQYLLEEIDRLTELLEERHLRLVVS